MNLSAFEIFKQKPLQGAALVHLLHGTEHLLHLGFACSALLLEGQDVQGAGVPSHKSLSSKEDQDVLNSDKHLIQIF